MKKIALAVVLVALLAGCGWLARHGVNDSHTSAPKTQICPDDPLACN